MISKLLCIISFMSLVIVHYAKSQSYNFIRNHSFEESYNNPEVLKFNNFDLVKIWVTRRDPNVKPIGVKWHSPDWYKQPITQWNNQHAHSTGYGYAGMKDYELIQQQFDSNNQLQESCV